MCGEYVQTTIRIIYIQIAIESVCNIDICWQTVVTLDVGGHMFPPDTSQYTYHYSLSCLQILDCLDLCPGLSMAQSLLVCRLRGFSK